MKCAYTDSLFSTDDEAFILRRLVVLSQHPLLRTPEKLFFLDYLLHFPENRPIGCGNNESPPVLLTSQLACTLAPTLLNDDATMLARFNLLLVVCQEEGEKDGEEGKGLVYLYQHLGSLLNITIGGHGREIAATFFRAVFLFLVSFCHAERYASGIAEKLCMLYRHRPHLAPHVLNLAQQSSDVFPECDWSARLCGALQGVIAESPPPPPPARFALTDLAWHLKVLARVAEEGQIPQQSTLQLLSKIIFTPSVCPTGDWRLGNGVLQLCRRLMTHPGLDSFLTSLANILQHLVRHYGDADIQDRARLYYSLLTTLSKDKLTGIVNRGSREEGPNSKHSLSCIMADTERLTSVLTIQQTQTPVFRLVEFKRPESQERNERILERDPSSGDSPGLEAYRAQFKDSRFGSQITLHYRLHRTTRKLASFDGVFSIRLHFSFRDSIYEELCDVDVPCLFRERESPAVKLVLKPRLPVPITLRCSALFNTVNGLSWYTSLPDVQVLFRQVFLPLAVPATWGAADKLGVFKDLWEEISREEKADYASALFCGRLRAGELGSVVEEPLLPFIISDSANKAEIKCLFFIPPQFHILLKIISEEDAVHFNIVTDNWRLLPHIGSFLGHFLMSLPEKDTGNP